MRFATTLVLIAGTAFAASAFEQTFLGEWTATAVTPGGNVSETLTVVKTTDGYEIKAKGLAEAPYNGVRIPRRDPGEGLKHGQ